MESNLSKYLRLDRSAVKFVTGPGVLIRSEKSGEFAGFFSGPASQALEDLARESGTDLAVIQADTDLVCEECDAAEVATAVAAHVGARDGLEAAQDDSSVDFDGAVAADYCADEGLVGALSTESLASHLGITAEAIRTGAPEYQTALDAYNTAWRKAYNDNCATEEQVQEHKTATNDALHAE